MVDAHQPIILEKNEAVSRKLLSIWSACRRDVMILGLFIYFGYCVTSPTALSEHPDLFESNLPNLPLTQITHTTFLFSYFQENDEEIGALGSILSWDDEEEAAVSAAVAATGSALDERDSLSSLPTLPPFTGYPQQISIIAMQQGPAQAIQQMQANTQAIQQSQLTQQPFQMMVQNVQGYATQQQPAYAQQPGQTQHQIAADKARRPGHHDAARRLRRHRRRGCKNFACGWRNCCVVWNAGGTLASFSG